MRKSIDWKEQFDAANDLGSDRFGTLWLAATQELVRSLREAGLGEPIENDYRMRAGVARGLYRVLSTAILHPNNLARAKRKIDESRAAAAGGQQ